MKVKILSPETTITDTKELERANEFYRIVFDSLNRYGIDVSSINSENYKKTILDLDNQTILIVFNGEDSDFSNEIYSAAIKKKSIIYPVALSIESRMPAEIISKAQSFDVYEQLRKRNLPMDYTAVAAEVFSRTVISECMPTICSDEFTLFLSHRRLDGEEITASVCDELTRLAPLQTSFRDIVNVKVGEDAQGVIDNALAESDVLVFFHTEQSASSEWILKELFYAIIYSIPVLWIRIDNADIKKLKYAPSEAPQLEFSKEDFSNQSKVTEIANQILKQSFMLMADRSNDVYGEVGYILDLFGDNLKEKDKTKLLYTLDYPRKGYQYPQRGISQWVQFYGRKPKENDIQELISQVKEVNQSEFDSVVILSNRVFSRQSHEEILIDNYENFKDIYEAYINGKPEDKPYDIVVSGAFPDSEEVYKQNLTYALICLVREILKEGYTLSFGAHPSFQELIFDTAKKITNHSREKVRMYISNYFVPHEVIESFRNRCTPIEIEKEDQRAPSLTRLRESLIIRDNVKALICVGGKVKAKREEEGIREEINIAKAKGIPVFLIGSVGGCTSVMAREYDKKDLWGELNSAFPEMNKMLMNSLDYKNSAKAIIEYLKSI